ncbi:hypothetical protein [Enterovibrio norvegicus]|uniref:Uncharacterized protein n=1 Tax=Enterovibrio norvegicus DSM 15893 TaxID=1121869 RepID=A0A1I5XWY3_9GAMM|nr:hypothetical protein [Enterovibrio norvegicus]SFQ36434.1 hypothetical protein SAMN03084138_04870 [Enterovibrio norvegicus DSM 15893]
METTLNTGKKAVNVASFISIFTSILCLFLTTSLYAVNGDKFLFQSISLVLVIFLFSYSHLSGRSYKDSDPIRYWASTLSKTLLCVYLSMSLLPLFFIELLPGTSYLVMTSTCLISGAISFVSGKHYFSTEILNQNMKRAGMVTTEYANGSQTVSAGVFHSFRSPNNLLTSLLLKVFNSILISLSIVAILFGVGAGFILIALAEMIVPTSTEVSAHAVIMFLALLPMTTAGMVYVYPMTAFLRQWQLNNPSENEK